ncbi:MAG: DNA translocase FtsK 4TM domain-containing protein [Kiritimatiellia bacterium]|jgi:S-DNA-T family DNA segregation ATPase FtsK/SpoIIIE
MALKDDVEQYPGAERPPSAAWMIVSVPVLAVAIIGFLGLISYDSTDIGRVVAPANLQAVNWMGWFGAWSAYGLLALFGLGAYLIPIWMFVIGAMMLARLRLGFRVLWMVLATFFTCAMLQFGSEGFEPVLTGGRLNIAPYAGGGIGYLLNDLTMAQWIGVHGTAVLYGVLIVVCLVMIIGPMNIMEYFFTLRVREREVSRRAEEAELDESPAEARRRARAEARAQERAVKAVAAEKKREAREQRRAARELEKAERLAQRKIRVKAFWKSEDAPSDEDGSFAFDQSSSDTKVEDAGGAVSPRTAGRSAARAAPTPEAVPASRPEPVRKSVPTTSFAPNEVTFKLPTTKLLRPPPAVCEMANQEEIEERKNIIIDTLSEFNINVQVPGVVSGPVITCYEIKPPPGVRVDKISTYSNDLQMALQAMSLRILSPIPGKNVMGIEIPNDQRRAVFIREVADSPAWRAATKKYALPMLLGLDVSGEPVIADLAKMPHILIAGATGSGKSVCLNSILAGFLLSRTPDDVRLLMVDPKMVEFTPYTDLPHLVVPIITAPKKVGAALKWAIDEMRRRLEMFRHVGVRNIIGFNSRERAKQATFFPEGDEIEEMEMPEKLPYIVIVIDEMADLMLAAQSEVEPRIVSLAQLSRAVGIHMILATQRPSVNIITGLIKANFPARVAFKVSQRVDSQTILDAKGAEQLIGAGDMLFSNPNGTLTRAQGTWIEESEVVELVTWYRKQGDPVYVDEIKNKLDRIVIKPEKDEYDDADGDGEGEGGGADAETELLRRALESIVNSRRATTSSVQRMLRIGYNRAARLMDELERRGCIGPANGVAPREILRTTLDGDGGDAEGVVVVDDDG